MENVCNWSAIWYGWLPWPKLLYLPGNHRVESSKGLQDHWKEGNLISPVDLSDSAILVLYLKVRVYPGLLDASSTPQCLHVVGSLPSHQNIYDAAALCCKDCRHFWLHVLKIAINLRNLSLGCEDCPQSWEPNVMYWRLPSIFAT